MKPLLIILGLLAAVAGIIALVLALTHADLSCPAGQQLTVITWMPQTIGKVTTMTPVYGCA